MIINKKITGERIYLRNLTSSDASAEYCKWLNDAEVNKYLETRKATIDDLKKYIDEKNKADNCIFLGIFDKKNNRHIGNLKLEPIDFNGRKATIGILMGNKDYWGKGIGTEATELIVDYAFNTMNLVSVDLGVISENKAAKRVYEKAGFKVVCIKKKAMNHDGKLYDKIVMEIKKLKLCLGTVQFGLYYGINNPYGKPAKEKVFEILDYAYNAGIRYFDTAAAYGNAEEILGEFIEKRKLQDKVFITSKLMPNIISKDEKNVKEIIENELRKTLARLKIKKLYGYYLHTPEDIYDIEIVKALKECKKGGLVENIGVSVYDEKDVLYAAKLPVDIIQIPYSVLDQRLNSTNFFDIAKKNNVKIFARSAFLQGLVLMNEKKIPAHLAEIKPYIKEFDNIIKKYKISRKEAALLFSYNNKDIDYTVIGVDTLDNLKENIEIIKKNIDFNKCMEELTGKFQNIKKRVILPHLWSKIGENKK